jgi:hypothetical protein
MSLPAQLGYSAIGKFLVKFMGLSYILANLNLPPSLR